MSTSPNPDTTTSALAPPLPPATSDTPARGRAVSFTDDTSGNPSAPTTSVNVLSSPPHPSPILTNGTTGASLSPPSVSTSVGNASLSPASAQSAGTPNRLRAISTASSTTTLDSIGGGDSFSPKRQDDFERHFADKLAALPGGTGARPTDFLEVVATRGADLQAKLLIHGRLYLTRSHLCFRSNILGIVTEKIHPLKDVVAVEKGTTAKWIQNAVYVTLAAEEGKDEVQLGYGSMSDRDGLYDIFVECWRMEAPERYDAFAASRENDPRMSSSLSVNSMASGNSARTEDVVTAKRSTNGSTTTLPINGTAEPSVRTEVKHTTDSGERYDEVAIDTKLALTPDQLYQLIYHNRPFLLEFYEKDKKLTKVDVGPWKDEGGKKRRALTYVMHMNNTIGPSKSDCIGSETVEVADAERSYEIVSETQTPGVPSGKNFKIRTRTCLTHTELDGEPATRMYCTTQCDWSASSMLKSTITPAVIKGQKEHHKQLADKIRTWITSHPEDLAVIPGRDTEGARDGADIAVKGGTGPVKDDVIIKEEMAVDATTPDLDSQKTWFDYAMEVPENPVMLYITALALLSVLLNLYLLFRSDGGKHIKAGDVKGLNTRRETL